MISAYAPRPAHDRFPVHRLWLFLIPIAFVSLAMTSCAPSAELLPDGRLLWSGAVWTVRGSDEPTGPLDNYFGTTEDSVRIDDQGRLHLAIHESDGLWYAAELFSARSFGYGTYEWRVDSALADMDPSVVLGLFTYGDSSAYRHREMDIEFSAWNDPDYTDRGQFVVQPYTKSGHIKTFPLSLATGTTTHRLVWKPDRVDFVSWTQARGLPPDDSADVIARWSFTDAATIPVPGDEKVHMNFYLMDGGVAPSRGLPAEVVIDSFTFTPLP